MDKLVIDGLRIATLIGVRDWERRIQQTVILDLSLETDTARAAATDDLSMALDYGAVARRVTAFVAGSRFRLIETLAERLAALLLDEFDVPEVRVRVAKPGAVPNAERVAVEITRRLSP